MKKNRIYLDTSVLGGCFDPEFAEWSNRLIAGIRRGDFIALLSATTASEVEQAPAVVRQLHDELMRIGSEMLLLTSETLELLAVYEERKILSPNFRNDLLHIAVATVADADVLVSWNFRHIVRLDRIRLFNSVNLEMGYKQLAIYSPREVVPDETND